MNTTQKEILGNHRVNSHLTAKIREDILSITDVDQYQGLTQTVEICTKETARHLAELLLQWADS